MIVNSSVDNSPLLNETTNITVIIYSVIDALNTTVNITLPAGFELVSGNLSWNTSINENETKEFKTEIKAVQTGKWTIEILALNKNPPFGDIDYIFANVTDNSSSVSTFAPVFEYVKSAMAINISNQSNPDFNQTPSINSTYNKSLVRSIENFSVIEDFNSNASTEGTARVVGYFYYTDENSVDTPARYVLVRVYDRDVGPDDLLAEVFTNVNGYFDSGFFNNNDGEGGTQDVYVRWNTISNAAVVADPQLDVYGAWTGGYWVNIPDGTFDIGDWLSPADEREPWWIYDTLIDGWDWLINDPAGPGWIMDQSVVIYPYFGRNNRYEEGGYIYIKQGFADLENEIIHEYGHNTMYVAFGDTLPQSDCPRDHYISGISAPTCAWAEGWATFQSIATYDDSIYHFFGGNTANVETRTSGVTWDNGDLVTGNVAASLWDFFDDASEDDLNGANEINPNIWPSLYLTETENFTEYWTEWKQDQPGIVDDGLSVLKQNTIYYYDNEIDCADGIDEDNDGFTDCTDADCTQESVSENGFCCGSGCNVDGGTCQDASTSGFTCTDGNCNTYNEACQNGELESNLVCSGTSLSCSGGSCESDQPFGAPPLCDEVTPDSGYPNSCDIGQSGELECELSGTDCYLQAEDQCNAPPDCDEKYQNACSDNSGFQCEWHGDDNDNVVEECDDSCDAISQCNELNPGDDYASCATAAPNYFADQCSSSCLGENRGDNICRSAGSLGVGDGCTADTECDGVTAGTGDCTSTCTYEPDKNKFFIQNSTGDNVAWFGDFGNIVLKGTLEQNSNHQRTSNDEFIIRNNNEDVLILDTVTGNLYIDGTKSSEIQTMLTPESASDDFIIQNSTGSTVLYVNASGSLFMKGSVIENGSP